MTDQHIDLSADTLKARGLLEDFKPSHLHQVLTLPRKLVDSVFTGQRGIVNFNEFADSLAHYLSWVPRWYANHTGDWVQLIAYQVIRTRGDNPRYLTYRRRLDVGDERQRGRVSVGFGGHIEITDLGTDHGLTLVNDPLAFYKCFYNTLKRELREEVLAKNYSIFVSDVEFTLLRSTKTDIDRVHLGLAAISELNTGSMEDIGIKETDTLELLGWLTRDEIQAYDTIEPWSRIMLGLD